MFLTSEDLDLENVLYAEGFEDALLGYVRIFNNVIACYDVNTCLNILIERDDISYQEAVEYFEYNVIGAYVGEKTPAFLYLEDKLNES